MLVDIVDEFGGIPIFSPETPVITTKRGLIDASYDSDQTNLVRRARIRAPGFDSLRDVLDCADHEFNRVARRVGAKVVRHNWGLVRTPGVSPYFIHEDDRDKPAEIVPDDHILVAEVDIIRSVVANSIFKDGLINLIRYDYQRRSRGPLWGDPHIDNFWTGIAPGDTERRLWLLDIEPILEQ